jgi:hypothetical protein
LRVEKIEGRIERVIEFFFFFLAAQKERENAKRKSEKISKNPFSLVKIMSF